MKSNRRHNPSIDVARMELSNEDIAAIRTGLHEGEHGIDRYGLLDILGERGDGSLSYLVEPFLMGPDPLLADKALRVLCWQWGLLSQYGSAIRKFIEGVPWDEDKICYLTALSIAGDYLRHNPGPDLLHTLLSIYRDKTRRKVVRLIAYESLVKATGHDLRKVPITTDSWNPEVDIDPQVLKEAVQRLAREGANEGNAQD